MKKVTDKELEQIKQPRTIKVKTLIIAIIWAFTLFVAVVGGWTLKCVNQSQIDSDARALAEQMVKSEAQK